MHVTQMITLPRKKNIIQSFKQIIQFKYFCSTDNILFGTNVLFNVVRYPYKRRINFCKCHEGYMYTLHRTKEKKQNTMNT